VEHSLDFMFLFMQALATTTTAKLLTLRIQEFLTPVRMDIHVGDDPAFTFFSLVPGTIKHYLSPVKEK